MVVTRLEGFQEGVTIFGGDFNVSLDPTLDTSSGKSNLSYNKLKHIKTQFHSNQLMDSWRTFHPGEKDYSYFSPVHQTYSRIDYLFLSHAALEWVTETKIGIQLLSDHAPIYLKLSLPISERRAWTWRLNESLLRDKDCISDLKSELKFFKEVHAPDTTHPVIKWEALKAVLRGVLIKHGSRHKRAQSQLITDLTQKISKLEQLHKNSLTENTLTELTTTRELLKAELNKKSTYALQKCKSLYYENSNKPGKLLARAVKQKIGMSYIPAIKTQNDKIVYKTIEIASTMHKYYSDLYNIKKPTDIAEGAFLQKIKAYINKTALPCLKQEERDLLEEPIGQAELLSSIKASPSGKAPGPDGYTAIFYKTLRSELSDLMLDAFNNLDSNPCTPSAMLDAHISLIHKPGKDPLTCPSYRPISLLNVDIKIYAKILAERLKTYLPHLVDLDQVGFVPQREAKDNTLKTITILDHAKRHKIPMLALSTDAEKAFDRVSWTFLRESLAQIGLGHKAIHRIMALYNYPRARIKINGSLSEPFKISNGTRQGCPLSPLLYALVMEHLAIAIRQNCNISGVQIRGNHHKTALYADDLLVYITQPLISLPALMQEFKEYGEYSNFKINFGKSEALNVSLPTLIQQSLQDHYPFKWSKDSIKYLGINIPADQTKLYQLNQHTLLTQITHDLNSWQPLQLSWFGRIGLIKMNILPRLLYQFQTIPTEPPKSFFDKLNAIFSIFIWAGSKPRINRKILFRQKAKGGLGLPNIKKYWEATVLSRVTEWFQHQKTKRWVQIEQSILDRPLQALWWLPPSQRPDSGLLPIICKETILQADKLLKSSPSLIYRTGPLSPIIGNPNFPPGMTKGTFLGKRYNESFVCIQALKDGKLLPLVTICPDEAHTFLAQLKHAQLQHWLMDPGNKQSITLPPTPFEELCLQITPVQHTISILYQLLTASKTTMLPKFTRRWEGELQTHLTGDQWGNCFYLTHKFSIACKAQETNYKIISRWYKCQVQLPNIKGPS
uniref:Reverse transcriptase domain-containing protein n=1 Tax=Xenopus tropicalis TaxID=8364 RepID=A0A803KBE4_XENTR